MFRQATLAALLTSLGCVDLKDPSPLPASNAAADASPDAPGASGDAHAQDDDAALDAAAGAMDGATVDGGSTEVDRRYALWPLPPSHPLLSEYDIRADAVTDRTTGLVWQRGYAPDDSMKYQDALSYCQKLDLEGTKDWRLPTRIELLTILDYGRSYPPLNEEVFPLRHSVDFGGTWLWTASASLLRASLTDRYALNIANGDLVIDHTDPVLGSYRAAKCVRGGPTTSPAVRFDETAGTALEVRTGLRWQLAAPATAQTFAAATDACAALAVDGFGGGWRLPTTRELVSLVDEARETSPLLPPHFAAGPKPTFWTATPDSASAYYMLVDFTNGTMASPPPTEEHSARCVLSAADAGTQ